MDKPQQLAERLHGKIRVEEALINEIRRIAESENIQCEVNGELITYAGQRANTEKIEQICMILSPDQDETKP
jgi:hypothetical protein